MGRSFVLAACLAACGSPDVVDDPAPVVDPPGDTDGPVETDRPAETELPEDTDRARETDASGESDVAESDIPDPSDPPADDSDPPVGPAPPTALGGGFVEELAPLWSDPAWVVVPDGGLAGYPGETNLVPGDLDGDGRPELYAAAMARGGGEGQVLRRDAAGAWSVDAALTAVVQAQHHKPIGAILDLDGDGRADLIRPDVQAPIHLADGAGGWRAARVDLPPTLPLPLGAGSLAVADLDRDGWLDVVLGVGACGLPMNLLPLLRSGPDTWQAWPDLVPTSPVGIPYALAVAPMADRWMVLQVGRGCGFPSDHTTMYEATPRAADGRPALEMVDPTPPDALFKYDPVVFGNGLATLNPMGGAVADLDGDGLLDLAYAVSWPHVHVFAGTPAWPWRDRTLEAGVINVDGSMGEPQDPWGTAPVDVDLDGVPDLVVAHGDDPGEAVAGSPNAPYEVAVYWNDGSGRFHDVTALAGLASGGNYHALAVTDLDGDAELDLLVGGLGVPPSVWRGEVGGRALAVRLRGTTSNPLGLGAVVEVEGPGARRQVRVMGEVISPELVSDPLLSFGLGDASSARVTVRWPSGVVQQVDGAAGETLMIEEPPVIRLTPASRHAPADGVSIVRIDVTPRDASGALRAAQVEVRAPWGHDGLGAPWQDGDGWHALLTAPSAPGETVVEVWVDGAPLPIRPRVSWD